MLFLILYFICFIVYAVLVLIDYYIKKNAMFFGYI
jgi:hypothetical protein